jgi:hypothetical protein
MFSTVFGIPLRKLVDGWENVRGHTLDRVAPVQVPPQLVPGPDSDSNNACKTDKAECKKRVKEIS